MFAQAEHKKTAQDLGIHSPPYPVLTPQGPQPDLSPRGMCTEVVTKRKGRTNRSTPPPPPLHPGDPPPCTADPHPPKTRRRAQRQNPEAEAEGGHDSCRAPGPHQQRHPGRLLQRPLRHGQRPQRADTGDHDGRRAHVQRRRSNRTNRPSTPVGSGVRHAQKGPRRTRFSHRRSHNQSLLQRNVQTSEKAH